MITVITGAASGIGKAVAVKLAEQGSARLMLVDRDFEGLAALADELAGMNLPPDVVTFVADLAEPAAPAAIIADCVRAFGGIDSIVSNAGSIKGAPLAELDVKDFDFLFALNTRPTWLLGKAALPYLSHAQGSIVATASMAADHPTPPLGSYSASKAALVMLVRQMALEWGPQGVRCNCVSPGPTMTPMNPGYADAARRDKRAAAIPLRKLGQSDDVSDAILFLIGPSAGHITAQNLVVDGGMGSTVMTPQ